MWLRCGAVRCRAVLALLEEVLAVRWLWCLERCLRSLQCCWKPCWKLCLKMVLVALRGLVGCLRVFFGLACRLVFAYRCTPLDGVAVSNSSLSACVTVCAFGHCMPCAIMGTCGCDQVSQQPLSGRTARRWRLSRSPPARQTAW